MSAVLADRRRAAVDDVTVLFRRVTTRRAALRGFAVMRIGFALVVLVLLAVNAGAVDRLWAPDAPFSLDLDRSYLSTAGAFSVFAISAAPAWTVAMLVLTGAVAAGFGLGWRTRAMAPLLAVLVFSLQERNPYVTDGGDNLLRILLIYLVLADSGACWSLDARRRAARPAAAGSTGAQLVTLLHNAALVLIVFQVCVVYEVAGLAKVQGPLWQNGTAVYYVLRDAQFTSWPGLSRLVSSSALVVNVATWGTVLLQISFPLLLMRRTTRRVVLVAAASLHAGIGLLMGLPLFSATMILAETVLVSNGAWERAVGLVAGRVRRSGASRAVAGRAIPGPDPAAGPVPDPAAGPVPDPARLPVPSTA